MEYEGKKLRHELKYYINMNTYHILKGRIQHFAKIDENMISEEGYMIDSLYFDDFKNSSLNDKIDGTRFRKKYRIRVYEKDKSIIKLEGKSKFDTYISKESALLSYKEYQQILAGDNDFLLMRDEVICKELYAHNKLRCLAPTNIVKYTREAYVVEEGNVRLTFDKNIQVSVGGIDIFDENNIYHSVLLNDMMVFEVKYDNFLPSYIKKIINADAMYRCAISKYVLCKKRKVRTSHYD